MANKMLKKQRIAIQKLEERVLFDAAGAAEIVDAAAAAAAVQGAEAEAQAEDADNEKSAAVIAPPESAAQNAAAGAEAEENTVEVQDGGENEFIDSTELAGELADAVEDIEVEDLEDIMPEDAAAADDVEIEAEGAEDAAAEADDAVIFADAFAAPEVETQAAEERELVIISDYVKDADKIVEQLDDNTDVLILKKGENPLDQINEYLDSREGVKYDAIHVVSHGSAGYFVLNDSIVDAEAVAGDPASWKAIGEHLTADGDIMIYGCNVAGSYEGQAMIASIAELTGADVAASVDNVGAANGWDLEYSHGIIDARNVVIDGIDYNLGEYVLVEENSEGTDGIVRNWTVNLNAEGTYYAISDKKDYFMNGETRVDVADGQFYSVTVKVTKDGETTKIERSYTVYANQGSADYICRLAAADGGADTIRILKGNVVGNADLGNIVNAVNAGGLTIEAEQDVTVAYTSGSFTDSLAVNADNITVTGSTVVNDGTVSLYLGAGGNINLSNITVNGGTFSVSGSIDNLTFGSVSVNNGGTFDISNTWSNKENIAADVEFTGAVTVNGSDFSVFVGANDVFGEGAAEGSVTFNEKFSVVGSKSSTVSIQVEDAGSGPEFTQDDNVLAGSAKNNEARIIFKKAVDLGSGSGNADVELAATYIGFNNNLTVGSGEGVTNLTVTDFAQVEFTSTTSTLQIGSEESSNDHVTFEAIDRVITDKHKEGYFGDKYRIDAGNLVIAKGGELTINNVMLDVSGTKLSNLGDINGSESELLIRNTVTTLGGVGYNGGTVHLDSVRYENGLTAVGSGYIFWGDYGNLGVYLKDGKTYTIDVNLLELVNIQNITFINRNDDTAGFTGSNATVIMSGRFDVNGSLVAHGMKDSEGKINPTTIDFEVGSKVNVKYESPSQQYILGGNYYELTVTGQTEKILTGAISVGASAVQLKELEGRYDAQMNGLTPNTDAKILARKMEHLYRGGISLGTTLKTGGNSVDFFGYTHSASDKARIDASGSTAESNRVSYHVAHNFVNFGNTWNIVSGGAAHENGGVGPNGVTGNARTNEAHKAFFGGTYHNLTIDTMTSLPKKAGVEILGQDTITFNVDADATVNGAFVVKTLMEGDETQHHHLTVNVSSVMTFDKTAISLSDANLHFDGNVLGTIAGIKAERDTLFSNSGEMNLTFASRLESVGALVTDGIAVTFNDDVDKVGSIDVYGWQTNVNYAKVTFNKGVTVIDHINTHTEYDVAKPILTFNGLVVGNATVDAYRGEFNFNYDGDQHIFVGVYDDVNISGSGVKSIIGTTEIKGVFDGNDTAITINSGASLTLSSIAADTAADPNRPDFIVEQNGSLTFGNENTEGMIFNGDISVKGNVAFFGKGTFNGEITLEKTGTIAIDESADESYFSKITNKSDVFVINRNIEIGVLHNYGTVTVENDEVDLDVYNHRTGSLIFDLKYGTTDYSFTFGGGENDMGTANINSLVNGGKITVKNGTLNLNNFTQGDKDAESGKWTYGGEGFETGTYGTLVFGATMTQVNTGNVEFPSDAYLGDIDNKGTVRVAASAGDVTFAGSITNAADKNPADSKADEGKFILGNNKVTFAGDFAHDGSLNTTGTSEIIFGANVSGAGVIGGANGYNGKVTYEGDTGVSQQIFKGIYNNTVTIKSSGEKLITGQLKDGKIAGDFIFNGAVNNTSVITVDIDGDVSQVKKGEHVNVVFNGQTSGMGKIQIGEEHLELEKDYSVDVTYSNAAGSTVYAGVYDVLNVTDGNIATDITANVLKLAGTNTFNGTDVNSADLIVNGGVIELAENSNTTFGGYSSINNGSDAAAIFKGGKNGTVTFSTNLIGDNVAVYADGLAANAVYNYAGEGTQVILDGYYINNVTLSGSAKEVRGDVTVYGELNSTASLLTVLAGSKLNAAGSINVETISVENGGTLSLDLSGNSVLGKEGESFTFDAETGDAAGKGVILAGTLNVKGNGNTVTVYGWLDSGDNGVINVASGTLVFAGTPDEYGAVSALVNNNSNSFDSIVDAGNRLLNRWFTVSQDTFTSELKGYFTQSKFHVIDGVTLTVDYFDETDINGDYIITNVVECFRVENGATLIFAMKPEGGLEGLTSKEQPKITITVNNLEVAAGGQVIVRDGNELTEELGYTPVRTLEIVNAELYDGENVSAISGTGNVVVKKGRHEGDGTFDMTGGQVLYGSGTRVYNGNYYDLTLNKNTITGSFDVANNAVFAGAVTFAEGADVTLNGSAVFKSQAELESGATLTFGENVTTSYTGSKSDALIGAKGSEVIYEANAEVLKATYGDLTLNGDHEIDNDFLVRGNAAFNSGIQSGSGNWTFRGNASGEINNTGTVTYTSINKIYGLTGTYNNLVADAANLYLEGITLNGTLSGTGTLTFEGENTYGDSATAAMADGSVVAYAIGANNVLKGDYYDFKLLTNDNGDEIKLTNGKLLVKNLAEIKEGVVFASSSDADTTITFAGSTKGAGTVNFENNVTAVYENKANVFGGTYYNLTVVGDHAINNDITVNSIAAFNGIQSGNGNWVFNGSATGTGSVDNTSTVTYGDAFEGAIFGGTYADLVIDSDNGAETDGLTLEGTMSGDGRLTVSGSGIAGAGEAAMNDGSVVEYAAGLDVLTGSYSDLTLNGNTVRNEVIVDGLATLNGTTSVTENAILNFSGTTNAKEGGEIDAQDYSTVAYSAGAAVFAAKDGYFNLSLYGDRTEADAITQGFSVRGHADLSGTQVLGDGIEINFNGSTNAADAGNVLVQAAGAVNTVSYGAGAEVYGGIYYNLTVGGDHAINNDITVNGKGIFGAEMKGSGSWTFNGTISGAGKVSNTGSVTYGDAFEGAILGGTYADLVIDSDNGAETDGLTLNGTLSGNGRLTVSGSGITGAGEAAMNDGSVVEYAAGVEVLQGSYGSLVLNGNTVAADTAVTVRENAEFKGEQLIDENAVIDFAGTTNAKSGEGSLKLGEGSTVKYNGTADLFANDAYSNLTLYGNRTAETAVSGNFTVNGKADISGIQMLGDGIEIVFNGTTNADDADAEVLASAEGAKNTIIYGASAAVFGGTYHNIVINGDHTVNRNLNINGNAQFNGKQSGSGNWVFNGTVSGKGSVDNTGKVTYGDAFAGAIMGGSYNDLSAADLNVAAGITVNGTMIVSGKAALDAVITVNAGANVLFNGTTNAAELLDGENVRISGAEGSNVVYADGAAVFQGTYGSLTLADGNIADGEMGYAAGMDNGNITVAEKLILAAEGKLSGNFSFTLLGSTVNVTGVDQSAGTMTYGNGTGVLAGTYANITVKGGIDADHILVYYPQGEMTVNGNTVVEEFAVLAGQVLNLNGTSAVDGELTADVLNNAGSLTNAGSVTADTLNNTGDFANSGSVTADTVNNTGSLTNAGSMTAANVNNAGDFSNSGNLSAVSFVNSGRFTDSGVAEVNYLDNAGSVTVSGSGSTYGLADNRLGANFTLGGSSNSIARMNNNGVFNFNTPNTVNTINNMGLGLVYLNGSLWMMATDEGMNSELFSDGHNSNFTVLSHMTDLLDADKLDADTAAEFTRVAPGKGVDTRAVDLHALLGGELDLLGIDSEFNELIHGEAPEFDEEELDDVLSEGEGFSDGFDLALKEIVNK